MRTGAYRTLHDLAEASFAPGFGRERVSVYLPRLHQRVHWGLGLGEARLRAESTILGAAARLRVHERAHVRRVAEPLYPRLPGALHERFDLAVLLELPERKCLRACDQGRHRETRYGARRTALSAAAGRKEGPRAR